jgi:nitrite reductase/ring-hydroxylating ferredoxin subunit
MSTQPITAAEGELPKWREDFPVEQECDDFVTRRDFVRFLGLVSAGMVVGNASIVVKSLTESEGPFPEVAIPDAITLQPGQWLVYEYPNDRTPAILIRRENGEFISFLQKCSHLQCPVTYHRAEGGHEETLRCHCHNGQFDIETGQGIKGPPRELRPLRQVVLQVEESRVLAVGLNEIHFA